MKRRKEKTNTGELSLTRFDGKCYKCNKVDHRANKYPDGNTGPSRYDRNTGLDKRGRHFTGKCNNYGKEGYKSVECWQKDENTDKRSTHHRTGKREK